MPLTLELNQTIAAPPAIVWAALTDIAHWSRWVPGLVRLEVADDEPFAPGKKFRETRTLFGREATEVFEVVRTQPPVELELHVDGSQGSSRRGSYWFRYRLEAVPVGTCLHLHGRIEGMGWLFRHLGRLFAGIFRRALERDLAAFKRYVELQPAR